MAYTPPSGDAVALSFSQSYTPPSGDAVALDLMPAASASEFYGLTDDVVGLVAAVGSAPGAVSATTDTVAAAFSAVSVYQSQFSGASLWLDGSDIYGLASPPSLVAVVADGVSAAFSAAFFQSAQFTGQLSDLASGGLSGLGNPVATISATLGDVSAAWVGISNPSGQLSAVLDDVAAAFSAVAVYESQFSGASLWLDGSDIYGLASPPSLVAVVTDDVSATFSATFFAYNIASFDGATDELSGDGIACDYDPQVFRGPQVLVSAGYIAKNNGTATGYGSRVASASAADNGFSATYLSASGGQQDIEAGWHRTIIKPIVVNLAYSAVAARHGLRSVQRFTSPPPKHIPRLFGFQQGYQYGHDARFIVKQGDPLDLQYGIVAAYPCSAMPIVGSGFGALRYEGRFVRIVWQMADPHPWWPITVFSPPAIHRYMPDSNLSFYQAALDYYGGADLVFGFPCYAWSIGLARRTRFGSTIMLHTIRVTRYPDGTNVPAISCSLRFDEDSWGWSASVTLKTAAAYALVQPDSDTGEPKTLQVTIDGFSVNFLVENLSDQRRHGETVYTVSGRSPLVLFAQPWAPLRTRFVTDQVVAAQLIDLELFNTGWSASYHSSLSQLFSTDWLVPGSTWGYQNISPLDAIRQIAAAVGARAYADRVQSVIHIAPKYPVSPWDWATATPDKSVPTSLARIIGTDNQVKPDYNQIYVAGQQNGVLVNAVRTGSAGNLRLPMVIDKLITFVGAGQERARNELCDVGRQAQMSLELPINATTGVLEPGMLMALENWQGLVTGISIDAKFSDTEIVASQQVDVRRFYL
jgi:hypothetical protein